MVISFVEDVCMYVEKKKYDSARDIAGVASHGKHTRATERVKKMRNQIIR